MPPEALQKFSKREAWVLTMTIDCADPQVILGSEECGLLQISVSFAIGILQAVRGTERTQTCLIMGPTQNQDGVRLELLVFESWGRRETLSFWAITAAIAAQIAHYLPILLKLAETN